MSKKSPSKKPNFFITVPNSQVIKMFEEEGYKCVDSQVKADFVVFPGGADVIPVLYGEKPIRGTHYNLNRDLIETKIFRRVPLNKPKVGICRGAQFLCVMNGGGLWQDVDGHGQPHVLWDLFSKRLIPEVTSTHHQMMRPPHGAILVAMAKESSRRESENELQNLAISDEYVDTEVVWMPWSKTLCFQPHPEYRHKLTKDYFFEQFTKYIVKEL